SAGPLVVYAPSQANSKPGLHLVDPQTLKLSSDVIEPTKEFHHVSFTPDSNSLSVSADGRRIVQHYVFNWYIFSREGSTWRGTVLGGASPLPTADGETIIDH